jgi:hypothetical protein
MAGINSQGVTFFWSTSTVVSTASSCLIGEVTNISGPSGARAEIDVTSMNSAAKEYLMALPDFGEVTFTVNYTGADAVQNAFYADFISTAIPKRKGCIKLTDTAVHAIIFEGYAKQFSWNMSPDAAITAQCGVRISGAATLTTTIA